MSDQSTTRETRWFIWNLRLHTWIGLFLLLFIWLFAVSGLVLNHPRWEFARLWDNRQESTTHHEVKLPANATDDIKIQETVRQLGLHGEIDRMESKHGHIEFRVARPGLINVVSLSPAMGRVKVKEIRVNSWGVMKQLHSFTGIRADNPSERREWAMSWVWSIAMDATAIALLLFIFSGLWIWYRRKENIIVGLIVLILGCAACGFFVFGLA